MALSRVTDIANPSLLPQPNDTVTVETIIYPEVLLSLRLMTMMIMIILDTRYYVEYHRALMVPLCA